MSGKPALQILLPFVCGIILTRYVDLPISMVAIGFILLVIASLLLSGSRYHHLFAMVVFAAFIAMGWLRTMMPMKWIAADDVRLLSESEQKVCLQGVIHSPVQHKATRQIFTLACDSVWVDETAYRCRGLTRVVVIDSCARLRQGDMVFVKGIIRQPPQARNPGEFDFRAYLAAQNIHSQLTVKNSFDLLLLERDKDDFLTRRLIRPVREFIEALICKSLHGQERALLRGLLLGLRDEIDDELRSEFASAGVIHVLAVSGLHVGFILMTAIFLLQLLRLKKSWQLPLLLGVLLFYSRLTGSAPPVMRASIMAAVVLAAPYLQRRHNPINTIAVAAFIILMVQPLDLFTAGFQLSFAAVAGIVLLYSQMENFLSPLLQRWREQGQTVRLHIAQLLLVSLAAQIVTLPLTVYYFNRLPVYALAANLLIVPLVSLIVPIGIVAAMLGAIYPPLGIIYMNGDWLLLRGLILLVDGFASLPFASISLATPSPMQIALFYLLVFTFAYWHQPKTGKRLLIIFLSLSTIAVWYHAINTKPTLRVTFFDVGQGDAALCQFPDGKNVLIDAGDANEYVDYGKQVILPYLQRQGIRRLDAIVLSHGHADHIGGVASILKNISVARIIRSNCITDKNLYRSIDSLATAKTIPIKYAVAGDTLSGFIGGVFFILAPKSTFREQLDENLCSIIMLLQFGRRSFLFTGDAGGDLEHQLSGFEPFLHCDVIKVPHHGSAQSCNNWIAQKCNSQYAVISVGRNNLFGLPSPETVKMWQNAGVKVLRTDEHGAIVFVTDGESLWIDK